MFPGAGAQVYYNEAGEPLGWDYPDYDPQYDDPEYDAYYEDEMSEEEWEEREAIAEEAKEKFGG